VADQNGRLRIRLQLLHDAIGIRLKRDLVERCRIFAVSRKI
jgi:hypothetical protein